MKLVHLKVTCVRDFKITKVNEEGIKIHYLGMELIGRKPNGSKLKIESGLLFELPLLDKKAQGQALLKDLEQLLVIEEKKQELFYKNIKDAKVKGSR